MLGQKPKEKQITVFVGCIIKNGKVLMVQRSEKECPEAHMKWELPGGKAYFNETPQESVVREILEETGIRIKVKKLLPLVQVNYWNYPWGRQQTLVFCFLGNFIDGKLTLGDHHIKNVAWVSNKDLSKIKLIPGTIKFIKLLLKN